MSISFRSSAVVYYGPHSCDECGEMVVKAGREFGGTVFSQPDGPIYPNTEWRPHLCDPMVVRKREGEGYSRATRHEWPTANIWVIGGNTPSPTYIVLGEFVDYERMMEQWRNRNAAREKGTPEYANRLEHVLAISVNHTFYDTPEAAWKGAIERRDRELPTWHINLLKYGDHTEFTTDLLNRLPECDPATTATSVGRDLRGENQDRLAR